MDCGRDQKFKYEVVTREPWYSVSDTCHLTAPIMNNDNKGQIILGHHFDKSGHFNYKSVVCSRFMKICGYEDFELHDIIRSFLIMKSYKLLSTVMKTKLDLNYLGWMRFHGVTDYSDAFNFYPKLDCKSRCVICKGKTNIRVLNNCILTISPDGLTNGRMGMRFKDSDSDFVHYVVWSQNHDDFAASSLDQSAEKIYGRGYKLIHSEYQYGHPHYHILSSYAVLVRTFELFRKAERMVRKGHCLAEGDFFNPITRFCKALGDDIYIFVGVLIVNNYRLTYECELDDDSITEICYSIKNIYKDFYSEIEGELENGILTIIHV